MPRKNKRKGHPQHARGKARPRSYHRNASSPGVAETNRFLEKHRPAQSDQEKAA